MPEEYFIDGMQPEVEQAVRHSVARLQDMGAQVTEISLPNTNLGLPVYYLVAPPTLPAETRNAFFPAKEERSLL